jgi:mono/diheme cytochrome c family protein
MKQTLALILVWLIPATAMPAAAETGAGDKPFRALLSAAESGDADAQNIVGVALVKGTGVPADSEAGHSWLHKAAEQSYAPALRNLGVLHALGVDGLARDYTEANAAFAMAAASVRSDRGSDLRPAAGPSAGQSPTGMADSSGLLMPDFDETDAGERVFQTFCAGCHGFNGMAVFPPAPSFALGDRLNKDDPKLLRSVYFGKGAMPSWGNKLSEQAIAKAVGYLRSLSIREEYGLVSPEPDGKQDFFRFAPLGSGVVPWAVE